ncbi:VanZ family protein [Weeksellaceae bacterium TAE3-ERU29]|nr:VanZ family protein [Weeksellaceae bacterium TAE3-ERU29]
MLFLTLSPVREIQPSFLKTFLFHGIDKVVHAGIFTVLVILYYLSYKPKFIYIILLVAVIGILIEIFQKVLPTGRSFEWLDWLFDLLGGILGLLIINIDKYRRKKLSKC